MGINVRVANTRKKRVKVRQARANWQEFILTEIN
jgi:hypothetical protein